MGDTTRHRPTIGTERSRLLARIHREFQTVEETIRIGGRSLRFTRVRDPDAVLDAVCRQEADRTRGIEPRRPLRMPYWAAVWESALALGKHLAGAAHSGGTGIPACDRPDFSALTQAGMPVPLDTNRGVLQGVEALDLGCGMGLAGMAMASLGARVTLVDIETPSLLFARLNTLDWDCRVRRCDWQTDDLGQQFDRIVASDVLYDVDQWPFVEAFARRHLRPGGTLTIGEPGRPKAEVFPDWIRARGWTIETSRVAQGERTINVMDLGALLPRRHGGTEEDGI